MSGRQRAAATCSFSLAMALATAGCTLPTFGTPDAASRQGREIQHLWQGFFVVALCVGTVVAGLILWTIVRYRRRGVEPSKLPPQFRENVALEILYTAIPVLIVIVLFVFTVRTQGDVNRLVAKPDVIIEVTGFQWQWRFHYVNEGVTIVGAPNRAAEMVIPTNSSVRLVLTSPDVVHSFYVPAFLFKRDLIPGITNEVDLNVDTEGTFDGSCAEFCGLDHTHMTFVVRAVPPSRYRSWTVEQQAKVSP
jgi:cytochrome c oxidase subunit 2